MAASFSNDTEVTIKQRMGFEKNPALCKNCSHNVKDSKPVKGLGFVNRYCRKGKFTIKLYSVCDNWVGKNGETLEL